MSDSSAPQPSPSNDDNKKKPRRSRDPEALFNPVQGQLMRACRPAVRRLARAARGRSDFRNELEVRACLGLARLAADLLYGRMRRPPQPPPARSADDDDDGTTRLMKKLFGRSGGGAL